MTRPASHPSPSVPSREPLPRLRIIEEGDALATCREITICDDRDGDVAEIWIDDYATVHTTRSQAIELARLWVAAPDLYTALAKTTAMLESRCSNTDLTANRILEVGRAALRFARTPDRGVPHA